MILWHANKIAVDVNQKYDDEKTTSLMQMKTFTMAMSRFLSPEHKFWDIYNENTFDDKHINQQIWQL